MEGRELITQSSSAPVIMPMSITDLLARQKAVVEAVSKAMKEGLHYGNVPGIEKPFLQKPGAELLCLMFGLSATFKVEERQLGAAHREFSIICTLSRAGHTMAEGVGSCSTMEAKYRYRKGKGEAIGTVPKEYWDLRRQDPKAAQRMIGWGNGTEKTPEGWVITKATERVENPDIADQYNTVLKMAKKRAYVDAVITACAASEFFTQDEDAVEQPISHAVETVVVADAMPPKQPQQRQQSGAALGDIRYSISFEVDGREQILAKLKSLKFKWDASNKQWCGSIEVPEYAQLRVFDASKPAPAKKAAQDGPAPTPDYDDMPDYDQIMASR